MSNIGVTGGPARSIKWAGETLNPTMDGESEYELSDRNYEAKKSGNGNIYSDSEAVIGYFQHDIVITPEQYNRMIANKDGGSKAGTVTLPGGEVLSLDGILDGEFRPSNGVATFRVAGKVRLQ